jgi:hypothetical protein
LPTANGALPVTAFVIDIIETMRESLRDAIDIARCQSVFGAIGH